MRAIRDFIYDKRRVRAYLNDIFMGNTQLLNVMMLFYKNGLIDKIMSLEGYDVIKIG